MPPPASLPWPSIPDAVRASAERFSSRVAIRSRRAPSPGDALSYTALWRQVERTARALGTLGVAPGSRVGLWGENCPEWVVAYLAVQAAGGVCVPLDPTLPPAEMVGFLEATRAQALITSSAALRKLKGERPALTLIAFGEAPAPDAIAFSSLADGTEEGGAGLPAVGPDDLAALLATSGTTGTSKLVPLTHGNILHDVVATGVHVPIGEEDVFLSVLPLYHTFECTCGMILPLVRGATVVYGGGLARADIVADVRDYGVTVLLGVPLLYEKLLSGIHSGAAAKGVRTRLVFASLSTLARAVQAATGWHVGRWLFRAMRARAGMGSLRLFVSGGAPLPEHVWRGLEAIGFTLVQGYGLTETAPVLTVNPTNRRKIGSVGPVLSGVELGIERDPGEADGEIVVRGPMVTSGYENDREATQASFRDGWFHTGDSGWVDRDGYLYISGRVKDLIVTPGGKNVHPEMVEEAINQADLVAESVVFGQPVAGGDEVVCVVVPDQDRIATLEMGRGEPLEPQEVETAVRAQVRAVMRGLPAYARPRKVLVRAEELPKTSTQKVRRHLVRELVEARRIAEERRQPVST